MAERENFLTVNKLGACTWTAVCAVAVLLLYSYFSGCPYQCLLGSCLDQPPTKCTVLRACSSACPAAHAEAQLSDEGSSTGPRLPAALVSQVWTRLLHTSPCLLSLATRGVRVLATQERCTKGRGSGMCRHRALRGVC